eukprot:582281-Hanusia_phi.AAC.1
MKTLCKERKSVRRGPSSPAEAAVMTERARGGSTCKALGRSNRALVAHMLQPIQVDQSQSSFVRLRRVRSRPRGGMPPTSFHASSFIQSFPAAGQQSFHTHMRHLEM